MNHIFYVILSILTVLMFVLFSAIERFLFQIFLNGTHVKFILRAMSCKSHFPSTCNVFVWNIVVIFYLELHCIFFFRIWQCKHSIAVFFSSFVIYNLFSLNIFIYLFVKLNLSFFSLLAWTSRNSEFDHYICVYLQWTDIVSHLLYVWKSYKASMNQLFVLYLN